MELNVINETVQMESNIKLEIENPDSNVSVDHLQMRPNIEQNQIKTKSKRRKNLNFPCTLCDKVFSQSYNLERHINTHTCSKPHICNTCGKVNNNGFTYAKVKYELYE